MPDMVRISQGTLGRTDQRPKKGSHHMYGSNGLISKLQNPTPSTKVNTSDKVIFIIQSSHYYPCF